MKSLRQLLRRPIKSLAGLLLLALAGSLLCANVGQYIAAVRTREQIERDYTTAALLTNKYMEKVLPGGEVSYSNYQPFPIKAFLSALEEEHPEIIRQVDRFGLISGYCPEINPINYVQAPYHDHEHNSTFFTRIKDCTPYTTAVLAITLEEISRVHSDQYPGILVNSERVVSANARIDQVVFLQGGFQDPTGRTLHLVIAGESAEQLDALDLREGERYLVYGSEYRDDDWEFRRELIPWGVAASTEDVDWSKIVPVDEIEDEDLLESIYYVDGANGWKTAAVYGEATYEARPHYMSQFDLDRVNACTLYTYALPAADHHMFWHSDGEDDCVARETFNEQYREPCIAHLDGTVEEFLNSPDGELWRSAMEQADVTNHALPVLTTPRLESVVQFIRGDAVIAQGRAFTDEEYAEGARVCVLSETLASANGLSVGDRIPLTPYSYDPSYETMTKTGNPTPARYSAVQGFAAPEEEYEIVGLYRQTHEWGEDPYSFLPNTVFVPELSVTARTWSTDSGIFQTVVLRNGAQEEMEALLEEAGYPGLFIYYDQGYSSVVPHLDAYFENVQISVVAGVGAWVVIFLLFLFLFPLAERKSVRRMWSLGAASGQIRRHVLVSGLGLAVPGTVLGGILGYVLLQNALEKAAAESGLALSMEPWTVPALAGIQLFCCVIAVFLCGFILSRAGAMKEAR